MNYLTDTELKELLELEAMIKPMLKRIAEIKDLCKLQGSFFTANHVCTVKEQTRTGIAGLGEVMKYIDQDVLEQYGLIRRSSFLLVSVARVSIRDKSY